MMDGRTDDGRQRPTYPISDKQKWMGPELYSGHSDFLDKNNLSLRSGIKISLSE